AAQAAGVPRPGGTGESSAAPLWRVEVRHRQSRVARVRRSARGPLDERPASPVRGGRVARRGREDGGVKVLLVGLGRWGEKHLRVLGELGVERWVADVSPERRAFAIRAGVPAERTVDDVGAALSEVDAVDLVTPADSHVTLATACLHAGKPCFI